MKEQGSHSTGRNEKGHKGHNARKDVEGHIAVLVVGQALALNGRHFLPPTLGNERCWVTVSEAESTVELLAEALAVPIGHRRLSVGGHFVNVELLATSCTCRMKI